MTRLRVEPVVDLASLPIDGLAERAEREGHGMVRVLVDEWRSGTNRFDGPGERLVVAWLDGADGPRLAGVGGLTIEPSQPDDATVRRVRRVYVEADLRRRGVAAAMLADLMAHAERSGVRALTLRTNHAPAARFYEALGFRPVSEPTVSHRRHGGR